ncbi:MAG: hypothetical protein P857_861 [Candidatus Xenolissoclinum pacificiensis L6]|uniref:Uncharacterized protein n=1 Tax=Candidatus Xenolissoclinum pacificiensis L6 TaxID=1401685 RepID=W2V0S0_9RICK|nr:MAG: hypothetical protein P857_861 [Candidatus Xenolissoclinum pacificiensis L6]
MGYYEKFIQDSAKRKGIDYVYQLFKFSKYFSCKQSDR